MKHITVTPAQEPDEVIVVGGADESVSASAGSRSPQVAAAQSEPEAQVEGRFDAAIPDPEGAPERAAQTEPEPDSGKTAHSAQPAAAQSPSRQQADSGGRAPRGKGAAKGAGKPDTYRETTLDDLESQPMPLAQKVVIIAAVVCIIIAVVYYFAVMR